MVIENLGNIKKYGIAFYMNFYLKHGSGGRFTNANTNWWHSELWHHLPDFMHTEVNN